MNSIPLIQTKIMLPTTNNSDIRRARLTKKLNTFKRYPLTIVHSEAGYGKSTAISLYFTDQKERCCWYSISSMDDDMLPFLSYIIASIRTNIPKFGVQLEKYINEMDRYVREQELNLLCSLFINEVLAVKQELILILDDFYQVAHSNPVNRWMEILLEHLPNNLHLIVLSRTRPDWKSFTRMKAMGAVLEITKEDLVLTKEEVELLLNEIYGMTLSQIELDYLYELTEGWVIALGLIAGQTKEYQQLKGGLREHSQSLKDLFRYLAMEVLAKQEPYIQEFLLQSSILEEMNNEVCNAVLNVGDSQSLLEQLTERNLFIQRVAQHGFRYHALFREFLEEQLKANPNYSFENLNMRAAQYFQKKDMLERSLFHYEKISQITAIANLLQENGIRLLESGKLEGLFERLVKIPDSKKDGTSNLWLLQGEIHRYRSNYKEAEACYDRAIITAEKRVDCLAKSKALEGKARIYLDTIRPNYAERLLYEAIAQLENSKESYLEEIARLYQLLAENLINLGHVQKAEKWLERARTLKVPLDDGNMEARLYLRTGKFEKARKILLALGKEKQNGKTALPQSHRETELLLSLIAAFTGNGEIAKELAQKGIHHGLRMKAPFVEACGWIRMGHAVGLIHRYDSSLAVECYETALEIMDNLHIEKGKAESLLGLCYLFGTNGEYERAIEAGKLALQETENVKDIWLSSLITLCIGIASFYHGRTKEAFLQINKAEEMSRQCGDEYGQMLSHFWLSYFHYLLGEKQSFTEHFTNFLRIVEQSDYEFFLFKRTLFGPPDRQVFAPLLIEAQKLGLSSNVVMRLLKNMNLVQMESHPGYTLRIKTLGKFRVWLGDKEIEDRGWQRGKAKELFQLFLANKRKLMPKEEIYQILWPGQQEANAQRDFKVALNALNHVLEPNRKARANSYFILREGVSYGLNPNAGLDLDAFSFEQFMIMGLEEKERDKAMRYLLKGLQYYEGDFLPDRLYEDWCIQEREALLSYFLRGSEKLAQLFVRKEEYDAAIEWCLKIIKKDRTWEEAYRLLMYCYYRKNNRPQAMKWYHKCCETLENELGVTPLEPTIQMYELIIAAEMD